MKTLKYLSIAVLMILFNSCQTEDIINKNTLTALAENANHEAELKFASERLTSIGQVILLESADNQSRAYLYGKIEKRFDGETNVLIESLINENPTYSARISNNLSSLFGNEGNLDNYLASFKNIKGSNYYPQLFIPFYDELKSANRIGIANPVLVIATGADQYSFTAYQNVNGKIIELPNKVDELFAKQSEVWVISINERVDSNGNLLTELITKDNGNGRVQGLSYPNAKFENMRISSHKESWAYGGSEVNIKRWKSFYTFTQYGNAIAVGVTNEDTPEDGDGRQIYQFSRNDVKYDRNININWVYAADWPSWQVAVDGSTTQHTDYVYYVIFEYDPWPTGLRSFTMRDAGFGSYGFTVCYRSGDGYYHTGYIYQYSADGLIINPISNEIRTNSVF